MKVRISLGWMVAITAIVLLLALVNARLDQTRTWGKPAPQVCQEDDECWDCQSMGNHICGQETN